MKKPTFLLLVFTLIMVNRAFAQLTFTNAAKKGSYFTFTPTPSNPDFHMKGQKTMIRGNIIATKNITRAKPNTRCNVYAHHYTTNATSNFLMITEMIYDDNYLLETNKWYFCVLDIDFSTTKWENGKLIIKMKPSKNCTNIITSEQFSDDSVYNLSDYSIELSKFSAEDFLNYIKSIK